MTTDRGPDIVGVTFFLALAGDLGMSIDTVYQENRALEAEIERLRTHPPADTVRLLPAKPEVIVLCGSSRFVAEMAVIAWAFERDEGVITMGLHLLPVGYCDDVPGHIAEHEGVAEKMDELHWRKIDLADKIFVVNIGGYIGDSTRAEIEYAERTGKTVKYLETSALEGGGKDE